MILSYRLNGKDRWSTQTAVDIICGELPKTQVTNPDYYAWRLNELVRVVRLKEQEGHPIQNADLHFKDIERAREEAGQTVEILIECQGGSVLRGRVGEIGVELTSPDVIDEACITQLQDVLRTINPNGVFDVH